MYCEIHVLFGLMSFFFLSLWMMQWPHALRVLFVCCFFFLPRSRVRQGTLSAAASPQGVQVQPLADPGGRGRHRSRVPPLQGVCEPRLPQRHVPAQGLPSGQGAPGQVKKKPKNTTVECGNSFCFDSTPVGAELRNDHKLKMNWSAKKFNQVWVCRKYAIS